MPITLAEPPGAVAALTQSKLQEIAHGRGFRVPELAIVAPEQIRLASGHPVYNLGLSDIVAGRAPDQLKVSSWRFIVQSGGETTAAETLAGDAATGAQFASVNSGPFVAGTVGALAATLNDPEFVQGDWEMRLLRIPALSVLATWAHEKSGKGDQIRPIAPAPPVLDATRTYNWADFMAALRGAAQQRLAEDDGRKG